MHDFISLTNAHGGNPFTVALHVIGIVEPQPSYEEASKTILTLSMGKSGKKLYYVLEEYEEVLKRIETAQHPTAGQL